MYYPPELQALLSIPELAFLQLLGLFIALEMVFIAFRRQMLTSKKDVLALLGILVVATAFRLWFYEPTIFEHAHFATRERIPRMLSLAADCLTTADGPLLNPYRVLFAFNTIIGILTVPLIAFHTELIFHRRSLSWFSGLLLACHPMHIRLSTSDAPVISSIFLGAMIFVAFHLLVSDSSWRRSPVLAIATVCMVPVFLLTRPLNFLLFPVLYVFAWLFRKEVKQSGVLIGFVAAMFVVNHLFLLALNRQTDMFNPSHSGIIAESFLPVLFSSRNVLVNPAIVSWSAIILLAIGIFAFFRRAPVALFGVALWYGGTMAITMVSLMPHAFGNTKYFLALIYPLLIITAHAIETVKQRWQQIGMACVALSMPLLVPGYLHQKYDYQYEYDFISRVVHRFEPNDQVLDIPFSQSKEPERIKAYYKQYETYREAGRTREQLPAFLTKADQIDWTRPAYFFCGIECNNQRLIHGMDAATYQHVFDAFQLEPVATSVHPVSMYTTVTSGLPLDYRDELKFAEGQTITIALYRMHPKAPAVHEEVAVP
jgi:hypothetical protein